MIALVPRHGTKNPIFGVLAHGLLVFFRVSPFFDRARGTRVRVLEIFPSGVRMSAALANFSQEINNDLVLLKQNFTDTRMTSLVFC